ncbi:MAG TPA: hypothetical protein VHI13_01395 [Candidatus Kapabacteria bacterium]|nr:hypothetical protein [Candidatus Kapabacteria bacterium]
MSTILRRSPAALLAAAFGWLAMLAALCPQTARAQCDSLTISNNTDCAVTVCFANVPGNPVCVGIPAHTMKTVAVQQGAVPAIQTPCGTFAAPAEGGCVQGLRISNTCCVDLCYHPSPCFVSIEPSVVQCRC